LTLIEVGAALAALGCDGHGCWWCTDIPALAEHLAEAIGWEGPALPGYLPDPEQEHDREVIRLIGLGGAVVWSDEVPVPSIPGVVHRPALQ
jgi:hypothetical protein